MRRLAAVAIGVCALALPAGAQAWSPRAATYGVTHDSDLWIHTSDGVKLSVDVYRPATPDGKPAPGRFPVLLTGTPYNKHAAGLNFESDYLVSRGYVQVIYDVRGTGSSEGNWDSFGTREQRDGYEVAQWAASSDRPWSDGRVGLHGTSYGAITQLFTAAQHPAGLKAAFPIVPGADTYRDISFSGGQSDTSFIPSWLGLVTGLGLLPPTYLSDPVEAGRVLSSHAANIFEFQSNVVLDAASGGDMAYDNPFYRIRSPIEVIDRVQVPTFIVGGWFDLFQRGEPMLYQRLRENHVPTRLVMGPWYHLTASSGAGLPADGVPTLPELELRWMDHYVMDRPDPTLDQDIAPVTYFENGAGHWKKAPGWVFPDVGFKSLRLSGPAAPGAPGKLVSGAGAGEPDTLAWNPSTGPCSRSTVQWTAGGGSGTPCETDDRMNDATSLSYDLDVGSSPLRIGGPLSANLFVASDGKDGQITARVEDVAPDGTATQLTAGWQVLSLRALDRSKSVSRQDKLVQPYHPYTQESVLPVEPGKPMEVDVEIFPTAATFAAGHKLRLTLQTADAPHLTAPAPQGVNSIGSGLHVYHDAQHQSELVIPVRDAAPFRGAVNGVRKAKRHHAKRHHRRSHHRKHARHHSR
ncbi:MAG: CocE/NonD family hydrolase [Thermoleophilaceae bacterium]